MDRNAVRNYFEEAGAKHVYLFGSMARGAEDPEDCDLAVLMPEPWDPKSGLAITARMKQALRPLCGRPVDLVVLNEASPLLKFEVIRDGQVLFSEDDEARAKLEKRARDAYEEFVYIQSFYIRALEEKLAG